MWKKRAKNKIRGRCDQQTITDFENRKDHEWGHPVTIRKGNKVNLPLEVSDRSALLPIFLLQRSEAYFRFLTFNCIIIYFSCFKTASLCQFVVKSSGNKYIFLHVGDNHQIQCVAQHLQSFGQIKLIFRHLDQVAVCVCGGEEGVFKCTHYVDHLGQINKVIYFVAISVSQLMIFAMVIDVEIKRIFYSYYMFRYRVGLFK